MAARSASASARAETVAARKHAIANRQRQTIGHTNRGRFEPVCTQTKVTLLAVIPLGPEVSERGRGLRIGLAALT